MNLKKLIKLFTKITTTLEENKTYLNELDTAIGDGDHGTNICRGFQAVLNQIIDPNWSIKDFFQKSAITLMSAIGGSSGPLIGTIFLNLATTLPNNNLSLDNWINGFDKGIEGIKTLGQSNLGDKTMLDTLIPTLTAFQNHQSVQEIIQVAQQGMESTKPLLAKKGRASYLGTRSIGHLDPGAYSSYLIIVVICQELS